MVTSSLESIKYMQVHPRKGLLKYSINKGLFKNQYY